MATVQAELPEVGEVRRVHPVADLFPMMSDEELDDLASDIKANGLVHPIVVDTDGVLIDGRNRLEACRRAGIEAEWTIYQGDDPVAFILSNNVMRRQLTKGQTAMAVAQANFFAAKKLAWGEEGNLARRLGVSGARLSYAVGVMKNAPELATPVLCGDLGLDQAYAAAIQSKKTRKNADDEARQHQVDMARLRGGAPDLADQVEDHRIDLRAALSEMEVRQERDRQRREATTRLVLQAVVALDPGDWSGAERAERLAADLNPNPLPDGSRLTAERLRSCAAVVEALADLIAEREQGA